MTKPRRPLPLLDIIAAVALGVPVIRYALAFQAAEPPLDLWGRTADVSPITGLLFGVSYEAAVYLALREAFAARGRGLKRWWLPLIGVALQVVSGVVIVAPVVEAQLTGRTLPAVLGAWSWAWSVTLTGATLLTFASVALARSLRKDDARSVARGAQPGYAPGNDPGTDAHIETQSDAISDAIPAHKEYRCKKCGKMLDGPGHVGAHSRWECPERDLT